MMLAAAAALALRVLVITGGHAHDTSFYELFANQPDWKVTIDGYPTAYRGDLRKKADVIVLYDMPKSADEAPGRERLREFAEAGKGIVALHHSLCSHPDWPWYYQQLLGGGCVFTERADAPLKSTYWHDEKIALKVAAPGHPVTEGLPPAFTLTDETYHKLWMAPPGENRALLTTDHPKADGMVAWLPKYDRSRVVVIQLGHDHQSLRDAHYRRLVRNAVVWAGSEK